MQLRLVAAALVALSTAACGWVEADLPVSPTPLTPVLSVTAPVGAVASGFSERRLEAPAGVPLTIMFDNQDTGIGHNVEIYAGENAVLGQAEVAFAPADHELVDGGESTTYSVPPLEPGVFTFLCYPHPATMRGTLTVR